MVEATFGSIPALNCHAPCSNDAISNRSSNTKDIFLCCWACREKDSWTVTELEYGWGTGSSVRIKKHFGPAENLRFIPILPVRVCQSSQ